MKPKAALDESRFVSYDVVQCRRQGLRRLIVWR